MELGKSIGGRVNRKGLDVYWDTRDSVWGNTNRGSGLIATVISNTWHMVNDSMNITLDELRQTN